MTNPSEQPWKTCEASHEGFPLLLRCPQEIPYHKSENLPILVSLTHHLSDVQGHGLPLPAYNSTLEEFDATVIEKLQESDSGQVVLVETFAGRRTYYAYLRDNELAKGAVDDLKRLFPQHELKHEMQGNEGWGFIKAYAEDFGM